MTGPTTKARTARRLVVEATATTDSVRFLSDALVLYLVEGVGLDPESARFVRYRLAVVEALTNVCRHAYAGVEPGPLVLEVRREDNQLVAVVRDRGPDFDPLAKGKVEMPDPADLAEGGYGLAILASVMDEIRHRYDPSTGNELTLVKRMWP